MGCHVNQTLTQQEETAGSSMAELESVVAAPPVEPPSRSRGWFRLALVLSLLYVFLLAITFIETGFKTAGKPLAEALIATTTNPFLGLMIGIIATTLIQSSSTTTSIVVGLVAAEALSLRNAVPLIMGANIGTTVTSTLASIGSISRREEFRRAFSAATLHDFFNFLTVLALFPLEMRFHILERMATWISTSLLGLEGGSFTSPVKQALKPMAEGLKHLLLDTMHLGKTAAVITMVVLGLLGLFFALVMLSRVMRKVVASASEGAISRIVETNLYLTVLIGAALTVAVQSSSITTSLMVPLVGTGILRLEAVYPLVLGANLGTTVTALLASLVGNVAAISIALTHLCFNILGMLIFLPIPLMRWPIGLARRYANWATDHRSLAIAAIFFVFYGVPGILILLTR
jgi:sodium-dependent phosphate cotransporter